MVNRVAQSGIVTLDLDEFYPSHEIAFFDLKDFLFQGLVLKEKPFREAIKSYDWSVFNNKYLVIGCSTDAIIPMWAYMLVTAFASQYALECHAGEISLFVAQKMLQNIKEQTEFELLENKPVVIKGCSDKEVPPEVFSRLTELLKPYARSIMYGEPCSTVPVFKKPK